MIAAAISPPGPLSSVIVRYCPFYLARKTGVRLAIALRQQSQQLPPQPDSLSAVASCEGGCRARAPAAPYNSVQQSFPPGVRPTTSAKPGGGIASPCNML